MAENNPAGLAPPHEANAPAAPPDSSGPPPSSEQAPAPGEESVGSSRDLRRRLTGPHKEVAQILFNLAKTGRSFGFYARDNRAIAMFLEELFQGFSAFLAGHPSIRLVVGADRFVYDGKDVYHDPDRETGLPFKLFRDGIRALVFKSGLSKPEMEAFLEILARRPTMGRDAEEEDIVTMLWKQSFEHVTYQAVEGFTHDLHATATYVDEATGETKTKTDSGEAIPRMMQRIAGTRETLVNKAKGRTARSFVDEEALDITEQALYKENPDAAAASRRHARKTPVREGSETASMATVSDADLAAAGPMMAFAPGLYPGNKHYPLQLLGGMVEIRYEPLEFEEVAEIRKELDEEDARGLLHLLDYCFQLSATLGDRFSVQDFRHLVTPIRRYLVRMGELTTFDRLVRYLRRVADGGVYGPELAEAARVMLDECASSEALATMVATATGNEEHENVAWDVLQFLMPRLDPQQLLQLLGHAMSEHMANILAATLIQRTEGDVEIYREALGREDVPIALACLRCLATLRTADAVALVEWSVAWPEQSVRRAAVRVLGRVPPTSGTAKALRRALSDAEVVVREEALESIDRQGLAELAPLLAEWFFAEGNEALTAPERLRIVRLVATLDPRHATKTFADKINVSLRAKLGGLMGTPEIVAWNRLCCEALAAAATPEAVEKLREIRTKGDDSFREFVTRLLVDARRRAAGMAATGSNPIVSGAHPSVTGPHGARRH